MPWALRSIGLELKARHPEPGGHPALAPPELLNFAEMRTYPECVPCILRASLNAARLGKAKDGSIWAAMTEAAALASRWDPRDPPIALGGEMAAILKSRLGNGDPYREAKREANARVLALYPQIKAEVEKAPDPLERALLVAAAGNALDLGIYAALDVEEALFSAVRRPRGRWDYAPFRAALTRAHQILYLTDNAGEIVTDRILVEELLRSGKKVTLAVRDGPVLNDVTPEDLKEVGFPEDLEVITTGSILPGTWLPRCSQAFLQRFSQAELVVSKGMGNFEGLSMEPGPIFFLLQAKCFPVATELGVNLNDLALVGPGDGGAWARPKPGSP